MHRVIFVVFSTKYCLKTSRDNKNGWRHLFCSALICISLQCCCNKLQHCSAVALPTFQARCLCPNFWFTGPLRSSRMLHLSLFQTEAEHYALQNKAGTWKVWWYRSTDVSGISKTSIWFINIFTPHLHSQG